MLAVVTMPPGKPWGYGECRGGERNVIGRSGAWVNERGTVIGERDEEENGIAV